MEDFPHLTQAMTTVVARLRKQAGLSQQKMAELSSIARVYLLQLEQGKFRPTLNSIFYLARGLGIPPEYLVELIEKERQQLENTNRQK
ncbi:MAG: helix-turn-helix domain-containing protein [Desulfovibrio sp.]|uniref:helix-turn-helix domain-containing protein n=1 Tax=Desulfovibrio sp. TaxID=885 RepID=UPI00258F17F7|nr:helix-turn-helix transcriptional regulator [Desulfovibrio sp.]MCD7984621.1 helix-turn-helix domain-containing protein [Desulfovibrio sp.]